jgi:hypothetical protein
VTWQLTWIDHFNAYSHCIVGVALAIMRTLAM